MLKADFHIHSKYSKMDCSTPLEEIISRCLETGINCIAIADHDRIDGALKMQSLAPFPVIVAEEIWTMQGEIIGLFLKEEIPHSLPAAQVVARIKEQDGLVYLPHPFDPSRGSSMVYDNAEALAGQIDVIEVYNGKTPLRQSTSTAIAFAEKYNIAYGVGSDAHTRNAIGETYVEIPEFDGKSDFLQALRKGKLQHPELRR